MKIHRGITFGVLAISLGIPADAANPATDPGGFFVQILDELIKALGGGPQALVVTIMALIAAGSLWLAQRAGQARGKQISSDLLEVKDRELAATQERNAAREALDKERELRRTEERTLLLTQLNDLKAERADLLKQLAVERDEHRIIVGSVARRHAAFRAQARRTEDA